MFPIGNILRFNHLIKNSKTAKKFALLCPTVLSNIEISFSINRGKPVKFVFDKMLQCKPKKPNLR